MEEAKKKRVLIIEDEKDYALMEATLIKEIGFEPIFQGAVKNPEQAIEWINKYKSDTILLDMNYSTRPKLDNTADGLKVIESLSEEEREKVICVSGSIGTYIDFLHPLGIKHFSDKVEFIYCLTGECDCDAKR